MKEIIIADISLREFGETQVAGLSFKEKIETAKLLEKLRVDVIEIGFIRKMPADAAFIRTLSTTIEASAICVPVTLSTESVQQAVSALTKARRPRLNIIIPTSTVQMEYMSNKKAETILAEVKEIAALCVSQCGDVEITAEDATRSEPEFLASVISSAIDCGVKTVTLCDSAGEHLPEELCSFIDEMYRLVPRLKDVTLSLHCKDNLGLAASAALAGVKNGAGQIKVSFNTAFATLPLEQFLNIIKVRGETLGIKSGVNLTALMRTCRQLEALTGMRRTSASPFGRAVGSQDTQDKAEESEFSETTDILTLRKNIEELGYDISEYELERIFTQFLELTGRKKVDARDIEALVADISGQAPATYQLKNYVINSGSSITATAVLDITKNGAAKKGVSVGDGPIDASFLAIEQVLGCHFELEDFQIQAVTEGREAMGDALVKLRHGGKLFSGRGLSTDIIGASIRAYLSAVNKIVYEDKNNEAVI